MRQAPTSETERQPEASPRAEVGAELLLSVVVPVFNQEAEIGSNIETIRDAVADDLDEPFELIVVSDGSLDSTAEQALEQAGDTIRVIHYNRNLGKGYAIKVGALEARGRFVAFIDADLDLDPKWLPVFVRHAQSERLDFAIGSKRHPASEVFYPRSRRVASWLYQQLVRLLFRLNVRDTQVGLKLFRREVAEQVLPLLMVKRFAFDLELLAVSRALGFSRIEELPVRLSYRFSGSGVRSQAVLRALIDTAAVFYRLRVLRYYQRRRTLAGAFGWTRPRNYLPRVAVVTPTPASASTIDYPALEVLAVSELTLTEVRREVATSDAEVLAFLSADEQPAVNWITATVPFLGRHDVAAVAVPRMAPHVGPRRALAAAGVLESRLGAGSLYFRFTPGNLRYVRDFPAGTIVVRRQRLDELEPDVPLDELVSRLTAAGDRVLYTPETVIVAAPPPLFRPHLASMFAYGRRRSRDIRQYGLKALRPTTLLPLLLLLLFILAPLIPFVAAPVQNAWLIALAAYGVATVLSGFVAALRFGSPVVGLLTVAGLLATHVVYAVGFAAGFRS